MKNTEKMNVSELFAELTEHLVTAIRNQKEIDRIDLATARDRGLLLQLSTQICALKREIETLKTTQKQN